MGRILPAKFADLALVESFLIVVMIGRASMFSALHNCGKELAGFHARFLSCFTGRVHSSAHLHAQAFYEEIMPTQGAAQPSPARFGVEARLERSRAGPPQLLFGPVRGWVSSQWAESCVVILAAHEHTCRPCDTQRMSEHVSPQGCSEQSFSLQEHVQK